MGSDLNHIIVVADDYEDIAIVIADLLACILGWETQAAFDRADALQAVMNREVGLCLLDVDVPHMNGMAAAKAMRKALPNSPLILIAVTGGSPHKAAESGVFNAVMMKPVHIKRLTEIIRKRYPAYGSRDESCHY